MALTVTYGVASVQTITNAGTSAALQVTQQANTSSSTSAGGAVNIDNTLNTGPAMVIYSNQASPAGRLMVVRQDNAAFNQAAVRIQNAGTTSSVDVVASGTGQGVTITSSNTTPGNVTNHSLQATQQATSGTLSSAANFASSNPGASCVQITGVESGRGSLKIAHVGDTAITDDQNASALSLDCRSSGVSGATNAQAFFIDATTGGTNGPLCDFRNNGNLILKVRHMSTAERTGAGLAFPVLQMGASAVMICTGTGTPLNVVTAPVGSLYLRTDGGTSTTLYIKESGTGASTGWVAK